PEVDVLEHQPQVEPDDQLHQDRRAAEEPDVEPGDRRGHGVPREPHDGEHDAADDADRHGQHGEQQGVAHTGQDAVVEEVVGDRAPVDLALGEGVDDAAQQRQGDDGGDVPPVVPDRNGLDGLRSGRGPAVRPRRLVDVNSHGCCLSVPLARVPLPPLMVASLIAPSVTPHFSMIFWYSPFSMMASSAALRASRSSVLFLATAMPYGAASTCSPTIWKSLPPPEVLTAYAATGKSEEPASAPPARSRVWACWSLSKRSMVSFLPAGHFFASALARSSETVPRCSTIFLPHRSDQVLMPWSSPFLV